MSVHSRVRNTINNLRVRLVLAKLTLVHRHEVVRQTTCLDRVTLRHDFLHTLRWVRVNEAEVLERLSVRRGEVKVGWDVARKFEIVGMRI